MRSIIYQYVMRDQVRALILEDVKNLVLNSKKIGSELFEEILEKTEDSALCLIKDPDDAMIILQAAVEEILESQEIKDTIDFKKVLE